MNNQPNQLPRKRQPQRVDGFIPSGSVGRRQTKPTAGFRPQSPAGGHVGQFRGTDGFRPSQRQISSSPQPLKQNDETAVRAQPARQPNRNDSGQIQLSMPPVSRDTDRGRHARRGIKRWSKVAMKSFSAVMITGVLVGGYITGKAYLKARQIFRGGSAGAAALQENVDADKLNGEGDGRVNILLLGKGGAGHEAPDLTDTIIVASIDPIQNEAALLSIPRDMWVQSDGYYSKINAVYANNKYKILNGPAIENQESEAEKAGFEAISRVVEDTMGIPIHYHTMVDFKGFEKAIDTLGGIDVNVTEETSVYEVMSINGRRYVLDVEPGRQHMDGTEALAFARSRYTSRRGDFDRAARQRLVLVAMKERALSLGTFGNPLKINQLVNDFGNNMRSNLSTNEVLRLYEIASKIDSNNVRSVGLADPPNNYVTTTNIGGQSVVIPRVGIDDYSEIKNYVRNTLRDGLLKKEDASIAVYNGTNIAGLAGKKASELQSFGYTVTTVADAPNKGYAQTIIVDRTNGEKIYTKTYLEKRIGVTAVTSMPSGSTIDPGTADFVIILGTE